MNLTPKNKSQRFVTVVFFLLGFFMLGGRAGQAGGLYLFGVILPWAAFSQAIKQNQRATSTKLCNLIGKLALLLSAFFWMFPIRDWLEIIWQNIHGIHDGFWRMSVVGVPFKSHFSSAVGFLGLSFLAFVFWLRRKIRLKGAAPADKDVSTAYTTSQGLAEQIFKSMTLAFFIGSIILLVYALVQSFTGFNFAKIAAYRHDRQMLTGLYRVSAFAVHPLSFAGQSLGIFGVFGFLFSSELLRRRSLNVEETFELDRSRRLIWMWGSTALIQGLLVWFSGSRMPVLIAIIAFLWLWIRSTANRISIWKAAVVGSLILGLTLWYLTSMRAETVSWHSVVGDRGEFWRIYWYLFESRPWFGHGYAAVENGLRDAYYGIFAPTLVDRYGAHNLLLEILANLGIVGAFVVVFLIRSFYRLMRAIANHRLPQNLQAQQLTKALFFGLFLNLLHGATQNTFFDTPTMIPYLGFLLFIVWMQLFEELGEPQRYNKIIDPCTF